MDNTPDKTYKAPEVTQQGAKEVCKSVPMGTYENPTPKFAVPTPGMVGTPATNFITNKP